MLQFGGGPASISPLDEEVVPELPDEVLPPSGSRPELPDELEATPDELLELGLPLDELAYPEVLLDDPGDPELDDPGNPELDELLLPLEPPLLVHRLPS